MIRFLSKTFSKCYQFVSSSLKNFDGVWKDIISVIKKTNFFFRYQQQQHQKENRTKYVHGGVYKIHLAKRKNSHKKETYCKPRVVKIKGY